MQTAKLSLDQLLKNAQNSKFGMFMLNMVLSRKIAFNKPHRIRVTEIGEGHVVSKLPFIKRNTNHLGGLHACALATVAEFTSGLAVLTLYKPEEYRLIMKKLATTYEYQGRMDVYARIDISKSEDPSNEDAFLKECEVQIHDADSNLISTTVVTWHIKRWSAVRLKK